MQCLLDKGHETMSFRKDAGCKLQNGEKKPERKFIQNLSYCHCFLPPSSPCACIHMRASMCVLCVRGCEGGCKFGYWCWGVGVCECWWEGGWVGGCLRVCVCACGCVYECAGMCVCTRVRVRACVRCVCVCVFAYLLELI